MNDSSLYISPGPHIFGRQKTPRMMADVIIALMPAVFASLYFFRVRAFLLIVVSSILAGIEPLSGLEYS